MTARSVAPRWSLRGSRMWLASEYLAMRAQDPQSATYERAPPKSWLGQSTRIVEFTLMVLGVSYECA